MEQMERQRQPGPARRTEKGEREQAQRTKVRVRRQLPRRQARVVRESQQGEAQRKETGQREQAQPTTERVRRRKRRKQQAQKDFPRMDRGMQPQRARGGKRSRLVGARR